MTSDRRPILVLAAIVIGAALLYAGAAQLVSTPRVHPDEHIYGGGGASLGEGDGLRLRGEPYELGPVYPTILASVLIIAGDRETAYRGYKIVTGSSSPWRQSRSISSRGACCVRGGASESRRSRSPSPPRCTWRS